MKCHEKSNNAIFDYSILYIPFIELSKSCIFPDIFLADKCISSWNL